MTAHIHNVSGKEFDFIIVGGGAAGLTLASRLSEDPSTTVLVLEAGEANLDDDVLLIPGQRMKQLGNPKYDWAFKTANQVHSNNRSYAWPRGKVLGGSSAINFLLWNKPAREHMDAVAELGNEGWNWERFQKYSKRSEKFVPPDHDQDILTFDMVHHGDSGPVTVSFPAVISNMERPLLQAMEKHGTRHISELSSGYTNGTSMIGITVDPKTHYRSYSANTYYKPVASRKNLIVLVKAHVKCINTLSSEDDTITATGVSFSYNDEDYEALCRKEVRLAAGAIMSPQILELSGIGDREVLERVGIDVKLNLPGVGTNVQEHLSTALLYQVKTDYIEGLEVATYDPSFFPEEHAKHMAMHSSGKGVFNLSTTSLTFLPLDAISPDSAKIYKTLEDSIRAGFATDKYPKALRKQYELQLQHIEQKVPSLELMLVPGPRFAPAILDLKRKHVSLCFGFNSPFSRGTIHVGSKDPFAHPIIDPHIYEEPYDLTSMVELAKFSRRLAQTQPFSEILPDEVHPGSQVETDEQIADTVGSCSMLPIEDGGVVDSRLKVYNTTNIRVIDLSVVPLHIGSHTQALAYALGEQAADIIKGFI